MDRKDRNRLRSARHDVAATNAGAAPRPQASSVATT